MSMILSDKQKTELMELLPADAERLIETGDTMQILDALDDLYLDLLDENQEPTNASRRCERLRDHIHWDNYHKR